MPTRKKAKKNVIKSRAKATRKAAAKRSAPARLQPTSGAPSLTVNDITQSLAWYCDVLGFTVKQRWEHPQGTLVGGELQAGRVTIYLGQDDWKKGRDRVKGEGVRVYWNTNQDIDALAAAIKRRGGTLASEPKEEWGSRYFTLEDPSGYKITVASEK